MPIRSTISQNDLTRSECVAATGISVRNFQLIKDHAWWPFCYERLKSENEAGQYSESSLAELAVIGGFARASAPLKIGSFVAREFFAQNGNHAPARFAMTDLFAPNSTWRNADSWLDAHSAITEASARTYTPRHSHAGDIVLIIADQKFVLEWTCEPPRLARSYPDYTGLDKRGPQSLGWIENWAKGKTPEFIPVSDRVSFANELIMAETEAKFQQALRNSEGQIRVNISLSIRNAFDHVIAMRAAKGELKT